MTSQYTPQDPNARLPGKPITSAMLLADEENPRAIAEGSPGAPRVMPPALGSLFLGRLSGIGTSASGFTDLDPRLVLRIDANWEGAVSGGVVQTRRIQVRVSNDNGSNWSSWQDASIFSAAGESTIYLNLKDGAAEYISKRNGVSEQALNVTGDSIDFGRENNNAVQVRIDSTGGYNALAQIVSNAEDE